MLLAAFRGKFFRHLGYVLDMTVVSACLYQELAGKSKGKPALEVNDKPPALSSPAGCLKCRALARTLSHSVRCFQPLRHGQRSSAKCR